MKKTLAALAALFAVFAIAACGSSSDSSSTTSADAGSASTSADTGSTSADTTAAGTGSTSTLKVEADPSGQLKFTKDALTAKAGDLTVEFSNPSPIGHDVAIAQGDKVLGQTEIVTGSDASTTIKGLKPGAYQYYCTVPGHREAGMEGTLTVN